MFLKYAPVAQGIEHRIPNPGAAGSIPARRTMKRPQTQGFAAFCIQASFFKVSLLGSNVLLAQ